MRFFGYYAIHSFINQIRKLMKTWVLVFFLVCIALGVIIGFGAAMLDDAISVESEETTQVETVEETGPPEWMTIDGASMLELATGAALLALLAYEALSADKNGGKIFLPADVNLLFPSPMKPQSVLMFRLATQLGTALAATVYLLFQVPNLMYNMGLSGWSVLAIFAVWFLGILIGKLVQVLLYTLCSTQAGLKKYLSPAVYGILLACAAAFIVSFQASGSSPLEAADRLFNAPWTRFIPFWGWLKGISGCIAHQDLAGAGIWLLVTIAGSAVLIRWIWQIKADFYEDAMAKSEQTAALMEKARSERTAGTGAVKQRTKERSDKLMRDDFNRGQGASVYFYKTLYNRRRFAIAGFLTKTMLTYFACATGVGALCRFVLHTDLPVFIPLALGAFVFFRAMGDPLQEDTGLDYMRLIPEPAWKKLMWSLLGGSVCSLADLLLPLLAGAIVQGVAVWDVLVWLPLILSVGFYASAAVSFIGLSVPASTGKTIKTLITVMFIYFGLLPDIGILAFGIVLGHTLAAALGATALNIFLGVLFFFLASVYLDPRGREHIAQAADVDLILAKKRFSGIGLALFVTMTGMAVLQIAMQLLLAAFAPGLAASEAALWLLITVPQYLVAMPLGFLILKKVPAEPPASQALGIGRGLRFALVCPFLLIAGNLMGILINSMAGAQTNLLGDFVAANPILRILIMAVLAPVMEEIFFRKKLIDRMRHYGGKTAVILSGILFGLFHGNLTQFFYAAALGIAFGYVYLNTGRLRYTIAAHIAINLHGLVISVFLAEKAAEEAEIGLWSVISLVYSGLLFLGAVIGLVILIVRRNRYTFPAGQEELPKGSRFRTICLNPGMLLFAAAACSMIVYYLVI